MMSAISAVAVTVRPPAPIPCTARIAMSQVMLSAKPQKNEPITNTAQLTWNTSLRPNRSPNLPASTVAMVSVSRYAVTTQDMWPPPPRSATIVGSAVATMVWSSAASSMPSAIVAKATLRLAALAESDCSVAAVTTPPLRPSVYGSCEATAGPSRRSRRLPPGSGRAGRPVPVGGLGELGQLGGHVGGQGDGGGRDIAGHLQRVDRAGEHPPRPRLGQRGGDGELVDRYPEPGGEPDRVRRAGAGVLAARGQPAVRHRLLDDHAGAGGGCLGQRGRHGRLQQVP